MPTTFFQDTCRLVIPKLMTEFDWEDFQAGGCMGNLGHESGGLTILREIGAAPGRGGYGWAQWTGPRGRSFLHYCDVVKLDWHSTEANYGYLVKELHEFYGHTVASVAKAKTVEEATERFEAGFERAGIVSMHDRYRWAQIALAAVRAAAPPEITSA